ncbi:Spore germination protein GerM [Paraliobacillus sp. PM-2]|uniref:GerMN domain-containing protein n=1 Tax=Paraliobacillus sp. PM-2 TaxID=1462524 RepID=UPI00061C6E8F|nr:GerMN domain-containing protein [Paraliobacillus sp. PM-2]CQR48062.1 Spore germination protein GerM [Paraliobacillus sp. PM-2]
MKVSVELKRKLCMGFLMLFVLLLTTGCGLFKGEQTLEEIDVPKDPSSEEATGEASDTSEEGEGIEVQAPEAETIPRELYLLNEEGLIVPQTVELPKTDTVAQQVLEYLIKDGPVSSMLPNGFEAVLPAGTQIIGLNLQADGTLIVDVSEEFTNYQPQEEEEIIQAMTYTLTQFDNVDRITLWINGYEQSEMPVNGTPLQEGYSRADGINIYSPDGIDLMDSKAVTLYYPMQQDEQFYYVPVTQYVEMDEQTDYQSMVQALLEGPSYSSNLLNVFNPNVSILDEPTVDDGVLRVMFSKEILNDENTSSISDEVMETLVRTLTDKTEVDAVSVEVEGIDQVFNEHGVPYTEPVTRDTFVPTGSL